MIATFETEDLTAPEVNADPYGYYGHLRETDPVHWNPLFNQWIVTRHDDVVWLLRKPDLFSSAMPVLDEPADVYPPVDASDWELVDYLRQTFRPFLLSDRPEHLAMRQTIHRWFTPRAVERWREELRSSMRELIEEQRPTGAMEVKDEFAVWLPLTTISWMLDIPREDAPRLRDLTATFLNAGYSADRMRRIDSAWRELQDYFAPLIAGRRGQQAGEDLITMLADGEESGAFTRDQCLASVVHLMMAGHETTQNLICNGLLTFLRNPDQWELLQSDPAGLCESATEECLRYEPSAKGLSRVCAEDVELRGKVMRAGERVFWIISSANRDPRVFADPDAFDITRSPNPHIAFGGGIHHCLGAALARVEGQEAFRALAELLPQMRLREDEVEYVPNLTDRELRALRICWD